MRGVLFSSLLPTKLKCRVDNLAVFLEPFLPHLPSLLQVLSITGYLGGASLLLAFSSDLVQLLTFPFFACYVAATLVYRWSLVGLSALFDVFRGESHCSRYSLACTNESTERFRITGKKFNPLRNRTEPANYSVDALLLGTILFVTLIFLFPTIAAFYLAFVSVRDLQLVSRACQARTDCVQTLHSRD